MIGSKDEVRDIGRGEGAADQWILTQPRAAVLDGLIATGMSRVFAEMWCDLWVLQGAVEVGHRSVGYWQAGKEWIDAQRASGRRPGP